MTLTRGATFPECSYQKKTNVSLQCVYFLLDWVLGFLLLLDVTWSIVLPKNVLFNFLGSFAHSMAPPTSARARFLLASFSNSSAANLEKKEWGREVNTLT